MYVVVDGDKIIKAIPENISLDIVKKQNKGYTIMKSNFDLLPDDMINLARVYDGKIVPKPTVNIRLSKKWLEPDGEDEVEITLQLFDLQPGEKIDEIVLDIDGAKVPVEMVDGMGAITISCDTPSLLIVSVHSPDLNHSKMAIDAT